MWRLESDSKELDEVMVVAYATAKKYSFTGAAATVKGEDIAKLQTSSISKALEGTVAGLQASATSGQPGTDADIRIRGIGFYQCIKFSVICSRRSSLRR